MEGGRQGRTGGRKGRRQEGRKEESRTKEAGVKTQRGSEMERTASTPQIPTSACRTQKAASLVLELVTVSKLFYIRARVLISYPIDLIFLLSSHQLL